MTDDRRIEIMAEHWIRMGGDAEGVAWCWGQLQAEVERQLKEASDKANKESSA